MKLKVLTIVLLFALTALIVGTNLTKPFWGIHDWNGARYGNIARNYLRYGLIETKFGQVENGGTTDPSDFIYYTHYQPLLPLLISVSYKIWGVSEFATRIIPLMAAAGFIVALYFIGWELHSWQTGLFASLLALAAPMVRYYGKNPVHEPLALFFASLSFLGAVILKKGNKAGWTLLVAGLILTALTNWSFVFLLPALTIFLYGEENRRNIFLLWFLGAALAGFHFVHIKFLTGSFFGGGLGGAFLERTSIGNDVVSFGMIEYVLRIRLWASTLFTNTLLATFIGGLILVFKSKLSLLKMFLFSVFVYCAYPVFFANASFIHSYFIYYLVFPLALLGGYFCFKLIEYKKIFTVLVLIILLGVWFERNDYEKALEASSGDRLAVEMSAAIKNRTREGETLMVIPTEYAVSRLPFLSFYSERNIVIKGSADWLVNVSENNYEITKNKSK